MSNKNTLFYRQKQKYTFNTDNEDVSTDGGVVLLEKIENKHKLIKSFSSNLIDKRDTSKIDFTYYELCKQRVYLMAQGYQDCNDEAFLENDPVLKEMLGNNLSSQSTLSRFENSFSVRDIYNLSLYWIRNYVKSIDKNRKNIVIDVDGTDDPTHGNQQLSLFNGYYGQTMFNQLFFHDGETGQIILPVLRPGNAHSNRWFVKILSVIVDEIRLIYPDISITIRADGGFSGAKFYDLVEEKKLYYCVGITTNSVLKKETKTAYDIVERTCAKKKIKFQHFTKAFQYKAKSWTNTQTCYAKVESTGKGMNVRYFSSNIPNKTGKEIYTQFYTQRGDASENRIKEVKNMCFSERLSCHLFMANYFRLFLSSLTYELFGLIKNYIQKTDNDEAKKWQIDNIRLFILKVGATIKKTVRLVTINLSKSYVCKDLLLKINCLA
jgi:hypothetical protein